MRNLLVVALLASVAFAGCSAEGPRETIEGGEDDDGSPRRSAGGNGTDPPHDDVALLDAAIDLVGADEQVFDVVVPENVTVVDYHISWTTAGQIFMFKVELSGCGLDDGGGGSYTSGGAGSQGGRLCNDAKGGTQTLTVANTGLIQGSLRVVGQIPRATVNATAANV